MLPLCSQERPRSSDGHLPEPPRQPGPGRRWIRVVRYAVLGIVAAALAVAMAYAVFWVAVITVYMMVLAKLNPPDPPDPIRGQQDYVIESVWLPDQPWFSRGNPCWNGATSKIMVRVRNQHAEAPAGNPISVKI